jgi:hypothetical protein
MPWEYEENPDRKHKRDWDQPEPGFVAVGGELIAKCPTTISAQLASELINSEDAILYSNERWEQESPERIYVVHDGHLYRATPTNPGTSYHGFPENPKRAQKLPRELKQRILDVARMKQCETEVSRCLKGK